MTIERFIYSVATDDSHNTPIIDSDGLRVPSRFRDDALLNAKKILDSLSGGIISAEGGSGKTTFLNEIETQSGGAAKVFNLGQYCADAVSLQDDVKMFANESNGTVCYLLFDALDENPNICGMLGRLVKDFSETSGIRIWVASRDINQIAQISKHEKTKFIYTLAPLSHEDIKQLANYTGVNSEKFIAEAEKRDLLPFCAKPISCNGLIDLFKNNDGNLANVKTTDLWDSMVEKLLDEDAEMKPAKSEFPMPELRNAAEWIALNLLLCGKRHVWTRKQSDCPDDCVKIDDLIKSENIFVVSRDLLMETLRRGLFALDANNATRFAHESYKNYLAAKAFGKFSLHSRWKSFFLSENREFVFPSRQETIGWYAIENEDVQKHLVDFQPEILLSSFELVSAIGARKLCEAIMGKIKANKFSWEKESNLKLGYLKSQEALEFINEWLAKPGIDDDEFDFIAKISRKCNYGELTPLYVKVFADRKLPSRQRHDAAFCIEKSYCSEDDFTRLKSLLPLTDDDDDMFLTIRGTLLELCYPEHLAENEIMEIANVNGDECSYGAYYRFLQELPEKLVKYYNPVFAIPWLKWAIAHNRSDQKIGYSRLGNAVKSIFATCWRWGCENDDIAELLAQGYCEARSKHLSFMEMETTLERECISIEFFEQRSDIRRKIAGIAINKFQVTNHIWSWGAYYTGRESLLDENDVKWIQAQLVANANNASVGAWWSIVSECANCGCFGDNALLDRFHDLRPDLMTKTTDKFVSEIETRRNADRIEFEKQEEQRKIERQARDKKTQEEKETSLLELKKTLAKDSTIIAPECFYNISNYVASENWNSIRIYESSIWQKLTAPEQSQIMALSKRFLYEGKIPKRDDKFHNFTVIRALELQRHFNPHEIERLPESVWERCGVELINSYCPNENKEENEVFESVIDVFMSHEQVAIKALLTVIRHELSKEEAPELLSLDNLKRWMTGKQADAVMEIVHEYNGNQSHQHGILRALCDCGHEDKVRILLDDLFKGDLIHNPKKPYHTLRGLVFALSPTKYIDSFLRILRSKSWAKDFIEMAWESRSRNAWCGEGLGDFVLKSSSEKIAEFYTWMHENYPRKNEPNRAGTGFYNPNVIDYIYQWKDTCIQRFASPGFHDGVEVLKRLCKHLPHEAWMKRYLAQAKEAYQIQQLDCVTPAELKRIVDNSGAKVIKNGVDLLELVSDAIIKYQTYLQEGTCGCPAIMNLWDRQKNDDSLVPRGEEFLSDDLKRYLDLTICNGIVINREVQISRKETEHSASGSRTDIWIQAVSKDEETITLCIEVKCSWNKSAKTAMKTQLHDKYMGKGRASHGILLLGWYDCAGYKKTNVWSDKSMAKQNLETQAQQYNKKINAIVIDCAKKHDSSLAS
jgi:hypothetical protein